MITKAQVKHIRSLADKKSRIELNQFVVEGDKMVRELIHSNLIISKIYSSADWARLYLNDNQQSVEFEIVSASELESLSLMSTPNQVIAIAELPTHNHQLVKGVSLVLDTIQDPGNMGSIIRIADWFGIEKVYCTVDSADAFNPKVIQASMGSIFRVKILSCDIGLLLENNPDIPSYAAVINGQSLNEFEKIDEGFILIGNESRGVDDKLIKKCKHRITIPKFGEAESLNAAVATGIICYALLS